MSTLKPVTAHTRAPFLGRSIYCPCGQKIIVFHFTWNAIKCPGCSEWVKKTDWKVAA